jgi:hypothetical protein
MIKNGGTGSFDDMTWEIVAVRLGVLRPVCTYIAALVSLSVFLLCAGFVLISGVTPDFAR